MEISFVIMELTLFLRNDGSASAEDNGVCDWRYAKRRDQHERKQISDCLSCVGIREMGIMLTFLLYLSMSGLTGWLVSSILSPQSNPKYVSKYVTTSI